MCWRCCFPSASFSAVSTMVDNLSSSGMDRITDEVEALRRPLRGRLGCCHTKSTFALCFIDGLSYAEEAVTSAIHWGLDDIPLLGGSAGDDLKFETTQSDLERQGQRPTAPSSC